MIKFEKTEVWGFEHAIRGLRNPLESWNKSDSGLMGCHEDMIFTIGENDLGLMKRLIKAGNDHSKFTRQIMVSVDITAPDYFFKEFSTYKIGTVENSTSTMHKIMSKEFTTDMFSLEDVTEDSGEYHIPLKQCVVNLLNNYRNEYLKTKDKRIWRALIQLLPMSFNYTRTVTLNYAVLQNMYMSRCKNPHKLTEWSIGFKDWCESLPNFKELFLEEGENKDEK